MSESPDDKAPEKPENKRKTLLLLAGAVVFAAVVSLLFFKGDARIVEIRKSRLENTENKTVGELIDIVSYGKARWKDATPEGAKSPVVADALWIDQYGKRYRFRFEKNPDSPHARLVQIFFGEQAQGFYTMGVFLDMFSALDQGKRLEDIVGKKS